MLEGMRWRRRRNRWRTPSGGLLAPLRVMDWLHFLLFPVAGVLVTHPQRVSTLGAALPVAACLLASAFALDGYHDRGPRQSRWWHLGPLVLALLLWPALPWSGRLVAPLLVGLSYAHSGPPRLKGVPMLATLLSAVWFSLLCMLGLQKVSGGTAALLVMAAFWLTASQLVHGRAHRMAHGASGLVTTGALLGPGGALVAVFGCLLGATIAAWALDVVAGVALALYTVAVAVLVTRLEDADLLLAMRYLGLVWALLVGLRLLWAG
jgi:hypothetical protein